MHCEIGWRQEMKILVLGATGMLGSEIVRVFQSYVANLIATTRRPVDAEILTKCELVHFDAELDSLENGEFDISAGDYIINAIGVIRNQIDSLSVSSVERAYAVNRDFPLKLAQFAEKNDFKVIQIATDCVFSGSVGHYSESSPHDPVDDYGLSKSAGESDSKNVMLLRCSIIGPEITGHSSLFDWVAGQKLGAELLAYENHFWNGITTKAFAQIAYGIVKNNAFRSGLHHLVPRDEVSKGDLIKMIATRLGRKDLTFHSHEQETPVNRTLTTIDQPLNAQLWKMGNYLEIPSIEELVNEIETQTR
jgi:dTDP-4-dehydrorhamnose reductase